MENRLQTQRNTVIHRGREVIVDPDGTVRAVRRMEDPPSSSVPARRPKATKLAPRVFGNH